MTSKKGNKMAYKAKFSDVLFSKHEDRNIDGERTFFWRADLDDQTIATLCRTKKECIEEVRRYLKTL